MPQRFLELALHSTHTDSPCGPPPTTDTTSAMSPEVRSPSAVVVRVQIKPLPRAPSTGSAPVAAASRRGRTRPSPSELSCHCLPAGSSLNGTSTSTDVSSCLCRTQRDSNSARTAHEGGACFCKWSRAMMQQQQCQCSPAHIQPNTHRPEGLEDCTCRTGRTDATGSGRTPTLGDCFCQEGPVPYGQYAVGSGRDGAVSGAICTPHGQPLIS
jgi:hypothetical protein